ncbi:MAG TPA: peptidoglycan-binding protein [Conexibacter sp.]|nr:peptidoglycan-binding protein [Conexibacter sp.]
MSPSFAPACRRSRIVISLAAALLAVVVPVSTAVAAQHLGDRALHAGDSGHDVRVLQDYLTRDGYRTPVAGTFGPETLANVKRFQKAHHLTADGVVGAGTVRALRAVAAQRAEAQQGAPAGGAGVGAKHLGDRVLKKGMQGHDVRVLQDYLSRAGFPTPIVGVFGPQTFANVKRFQQAHGLKADGVVGSSTVNALRNLGDSAGNSGAPVNAPVGHATVRSDGTAVAPSDAPQVVKEVIAAGNRIATKPYVWGGGHASWNASGYDCSGSVSYALHGAGLLSSPLVSGDFGSWGSSGRGRWITIFSNGGHVFMTVAGVRFDTSGANPSRWQTDMRSSSGYAISHPTGL